MLYCAGEKVLEINKNTRDATVDKANETYDNIQKLIADNFDKKT